MFSASLIKQIKERGPVDAKSEYNDNIIVRSADEVIHYIRMKFYNMASRDDLKALLVTMTKTPLRHPAVIQLLKKYENSALEEFHEAIKLFALNDSELKRAGLLDDTKDMGTIIELYLDEEDNELAFNLLREMIFLPFASKEAWNAYVDFIRGLGTSETVASETLISEVKGGRMAIATATTTALQPTQILPKGKYLNISSKKRNTLKPIDHSPKIDTVPVKSTNTIPPIPAKTSVKELFVSKAQWGSFNI